MQQSCSFSNIPSLIISDPEWLAWAKIIDSYYAAKGDKFDCDHGVKHWHAVANTATDFVEKTTNNHHLAILAHIAGLLHDCGLICGDEGHEKNGAVIAKAFLVARFSHQLTVDEIETICHAIANHSNGKEVKTIIDAAILFADKIDVSRERIFTVTNELLAEANKIRRIEYTITPKEIVVKYHVDDDFNPDIFFAWRKAYRAPAKAAKFTNRSFSLFLNDTKYELPKK